MSKNQTVTELPTHILAYIDILGASKKIEHDEKSFFITCQKVFSESLRRHENFCRTRNMLGDTTTMGYIASNISIKTFSDNIVIFCKLPINFETDTDKLFLIMCSMLMISTEVQCGFLRKNILVRGAITIGTFDEAHLGNQYISNSMILGKALVRASDLEKQIAIFPRIVIDYNIVYQLEIIKEICEKFPEKSWIVKDYDGIFYLDYLNDIGGNIPNRIDLIEKSDHYISEEILEIEKKHPSASLNSIKVLQKFVWHKKYLETWLNRLKADV